MAVEAGISLVNQTPCHAKVWVMLGFAAELGYIHHRR